MQSPVTPLIQSPRPPHTSICGPGNGTFLLEGQLWFQYGGMLTPAFHHDILRPSMGHMAYSVQLMVVSPPLFHLHISHQAQSQFTLKQIYLSNIHQTQPPRIMRSIPETHTSHTRSAHTHCQMLKLPSTAKPVPSCRHMDTLLPILCGTHLNTHVLLPYRDKNLQLWWGCIWVPRVLSSGWEPLFWDRFNYQGEKVSPAEGGRAGEGEEMEALGLPGHPPLCQSECGQERPEPLGRSTQEGQTLHTGPTSTDEEWEQLVWQGPPCWGGQGHVQGSGDNNQWHLLDPLFSGLPPCASAEVPEEIQRLLGDGASITWWVSWR